LAVPPEVCGFMPVRVVAVGAHAKRSQQGSATGEHRMGNRGQDPRCEY